MSTIQSAPDTSLAKPGNGQPPQRRDLTIRERLESPDFAKAVAMVMPKHLTPDRFVRVAILALTRTPKLANCDKASFFNALMTLSQYGLEPDGRRAHLIPFENRSRGVTECQLIIDYKGLAELAQRSGLVSNIHADVVCENDIFEFDRGEIKKHVIHFKQDRGKVYAVYALCRFKDGSEKCDVMTVADVERIRARSRAGKNGPWVSDWNEMAKKTVFRRLSKWLVLSPEFRDIVDADDDNFEGSVVEASESARAMLPTTGLADAIGMSEDDIDTSTAQDGGEDVSPASDAPAAHQDGGADGDATPPDLSTEDKFWDAISANSAEQGIDPEAMPPLVAAIKRNNKLSTLPARQKVYEAFAAGKIDMNKGTIIE